jgi:hypothetical protein
MARSFVEIYPNFKQAHELLNKTNEYNLSSEELCKQGKMFQGLLYKGVNTLSWKPEKLIASFIKEYKSVNNNELNIDWYFQCFFIWQRLKGEFDRRAERSGSVRTNKVRLFEEMIYSVFQDGIKKYKIKFIRSDENPKLKIPNNAIQCHNFYWWIKT